MVTLCSLFHLNIDSWLSTHCYMLYIATLKVQNIHTYNSHSHEIWSGQTKLFPTDLNDWKAHTEAKLFLFGPSKRKKVQYFQTRVVLEPQKVPVSVKVWMYPTKFGVWHRWHAKVSVFPKCKCGLCKTTRTGIQRGLYIVITCAKLHHNKSHVYGIIIVL